MRWVSAFYRRYSWHLLVVALAVFPYLFHKAETLPANNSIETWLPHESLVRSRYEEFKQYFGAEEIILIGLEDVEENDPIVESLCRRLERHPGIRSCWSPARLRNLMRRLGVSEAEIDRRLRGLAVSDKENLIALVATLSEQGLKNRIGTVADVRRELRYCQLPPDRVRLAGAPVVVAELDRLGGRQSNRRYFLVTLAISLALLYYAVRHWGLAFATLGLTVWAINVTLGLVHLLGGQMNFILDALPVMVMVFTLAVAVHFFHYYSGAADAADPLASALSAAWRPCFLATITTCIGLASLAVSDIWPVRQFGFAAALGACVALAGGLGLTPALLTVLKLSPERLHVRAGGASFERAASWLVTHSGKVLVGATVVVFVAGAGLLQLHSKIDPLDFLPQNARVLRDIKDVQQNLTSTESIEVMVDFGDRDLSFVDKLEEVRMIEDVLRQHPAVQHVMSLASFFPKQLPQDPLELTRLLKTAAAHEGETEYISEDQRVWRISVRTDPQCGLSQQQCFEELSAMTRDLPVRLTGIAPLLEFAQQEIFHSFWSSFALAFVIISAVMALSLRSLRAGAVAMIPNITPISLVFGLLGWVRYPVDIGMMMTGSIALGLAVDGTFHFLVRYMDRRKKGEDRADAAEWALTRTAPPILQATLIVSVGMLALTLSNFRPTMRFGYLMAAILAAALLGDLVILPCLLSLGRRGNVRPTRAPHFASSREASRSPLRPREMALL